MARSARTARRKAMREVPRSIAGLRARLAATPLPGAEAARADRARRMLDAWLGTAERHGVPYRDAVRAMATGEVARQVAGALLAETMRDPPPIVTEAACAAGCAFCCILDGPDGGTITEAEARALHSALAPLAGHPDGRDWHPQACPALDPETRTCRAYDARPLLCRSFLSRDADACRVNAEGGAAEGAGLLGAHLDYLAIHALSRETLVGLVKVSTFALREIAAASVEGASCDTALARARHTPRVLDDTRRGTARAASAASRPRRAGRDAASGPEGENRN
ncbi:YkgJ family cysteine cluster protein [Palleronia sp. LCG004]|uniref:YkgJ family cysteine cluster protein n=1 Tax=Palleronia sp. LCG004 TaxID=3079304 RepID=UPI0029425968|nr:YkgJ family cysteine cluster protein [Palleronia sp. LCG004]WOI56594.1 YkgJ family cysteine cluster protein [Palleronia sp. LCG004]